ncbi:response regulator transcription factor [Nonomuraea angiospora]
MGHAISRVEGPRAVRGWPGVRWGSWRAAPYLLITEATGIGWFVALSVAMPTSLTLTVVWVGAPLMMATVLMWRGGAMHRRRARAAQPRGRAHARACGHRRRAHAADPHRRGPAGGTVIDPEAVVRLLSRRCRGSLLDSLSPREREVPALMAEGRSNTAIAARLIVTEGAVEKHISDIFARGSSPCPGRAHLSGPLMGMLDGLGWLDDLAHW